MGVARGEKNNKIKEIVNKKLMKQVSDISTEEFFPYFEQYTAPCAKGGSGYTQKRRCCYHHEDTGSAMIFERGDGGAIYHCFGCGTNVSPVQFLYDRGLSWANAYKTFNIAKNFNDSIKTDLITVRKFDRVTLFTEKFRGSIPNGYELDEKDIYTFNVPAESDLITYYKVVFRFGKKKEIRQGYFNNNDQFIYEKPENPVYFNYCKALQWRENKLSNKSYQAKLIIAEGEKDCVTLERLSLDIKYVPISLKGMSEAQAKKWMQELLDGLESEVYFIGDEDLAGLDYRDFCFEACKDYVEHFYIINLSRLTTELCEGMDVTDWFKGVSNNIMQAKIVFYNVIQNIFELHDYSFSKKWARIETKESKKPSYSVKLNLHNIESFFQYNRCFLKQDVISRYFRGDFGMLQPVYDPTQTYLPIHFYKLRDLLNMPTIMDGKIIAGMNIVKVNHLEMEVQRFLQMKTFNDMLDTINHPPINSKFNETITFSWKEEGSDKRAEVYHYEVPELLHFLLENIEFVSSDPDEIKLQKILIYKALIACPAVLRNNALHQVSIKGDLRLIGSNSIGKTEFVSALFGEGYKYSKHNISWFQKMYRFDVTSVNDQKIAASSPCVFLDEGNVAGKASEQRASMDNMTVKFIEKYETQQTTIVKRGIIVSASNHKDVSIDLHAERRMWAVEVARLPWLKKMRCKYYYNTEAQKKFWNQYINEKDFQETIFEDDGKEYYFKFPVLEFWRQMNALYLHYLDNGKLDTILKLNGTFETGELGFYKKIWMIDKYLLHDIENEIERAHNWNLPGIFIPLDVLRATWQLAFGSALLEEKYKNVIAMKAKSDIYALRAKERPVFRRYKSRDKFEKVQGYHAFLPPFSTSIKNHIQVLRNSENISSNIAGQIIATYGIEEYCEKIEENPVSMNAKNNEAWFVDMDD